MVETACRSVAGCTIDVDLTLLRLRLGIAHFAGGVLGVFRDVVHAICHFIDGSGHQFHLLGLLLTALLGLGGVVAQFAGKTGPGHWRTLAVPDHQSQLGGEGVEVACQLRDFILAMGVEAVGQVALAAGDVGHGVHGFLQWTHDAAQAIRMTSSAMIKQSPAHERGLQTWP